MKPYLAEALGTFVLVVGGVGSAVLAGDKIGHTGIALAFGLSLLAMAYAGGNAIGQRQYQERYGGNDPAQSAAGARMDPPYAWPSGSVAGLRRAQSLPSAAAFM